MERRVRSVRKVENVTYSCKLVERSEGARVSMIKAEEDKKKPLWLKGTAKSSKKVCVRVSGKRSEN